MGRIQLNPAAAKAQATKLLNAADGLEINSTNNFSGSTTISGNALAKESSANVQRSVEIIKAALERDIQNIQTVVDSFVRADQSIAEDLRNSVLPSIQGGK